MKILAMSLWKFVNKSKPLFVLFILSLCSSIAILFPLSDIPETWEYGAEFGKYVYDLSIGFILSYLFFYLVVFRKEEADKKNINDRVSAAATLIVIHGYDIFKCLVNHNQHLKKTIVFPPTESQLDTLCSTANVYKPPFSMSSKSDPNWKDLLLTHKKEIDKNLNRTFVILPYIDSELIGLLTKIEDCNLMWQAEHIILRVAPTSELADLTMWSVPFKQFFDLIHQLNTYCNKHFNEYHHHVRMREDRLKL